MELTPQSARSPTSSSRYTSNPQPLYEYPSPAHRVSSHRPNECFQDTGIYPRPLPGSYNGNVNESQSPTATNSSECKWPTTGNQHSDTSRSSLSTPNILSADYDPFAPCLPTTSSTPPYSYDIYSTQTAEVTVLSESLLSSGYSSQRSSFSSTPASEILTQAGSVHSYTPKIKMEDHNNYVTGSEAMLMSSPQLSHNQLVTAENSYPGSLDATFYSAQSTIGWFKMDYENNPGLPSISSLPISHYDRRSESCDRGSASGSKSQISNTATKIRQPRHLTTKEEASYQCHVKGCEKFFGRSYNYKAHMETHVMGREYPYPCPVKDCDKKFMRKTDLQRHNDSVHMRQKNHKCEYCSRHFARKDTLRRHMEDGCSKRFDIETVDFRPTQRYSNSEQSSSMGGPPQSRASDTQHRHASYSSSVHYSPPPTSGSMAYGTHTSSLGAYLERSEHVVDDATHDPWSN